MAKKIIAFILIIAIFCSCIVLPVSADFDAPSLLEFLFGSMDHVNLRDYIASFLPRNSPGCPSSPDGLHHWDAPVLAFLGEFDCHCTYCAESLSSYLETGTDFVDTEQFLNDAIQQLPAQTITNTGGYYITVYPGAFQTYGYTTSLMPYTSGLSYSNRYSYDMILYTYSDHVSFRCSPLDGQSGYSTPDFYLANYWGTNSQFIIPTSGMYRYISSPFYRVTIDGQSFSADYSSTSFVHYNKDYKLEVWSEMPASSLHFPSRSSFLTYDVYFHVMEVVPDTALNISSGDTYNIDNRVSNYVTQYLVDNSVNTTQIINETNNTYYSPITNETYDMSGWTYDYSTRTYNITIDGSDGATVTFGDNAIQIVEGNVTNNYYYYITPSSDPDDPGGDTSGLLAWLQEVWPNLMSKLDEIKDAIGDGGSGSGSDHWWQDSDNPDDPDDPDADDDLGILELFKTVLRGLINILNGFLSLIFDGIENLIEWIGSIGDFFDYFSPNSDVNIWTVEEGST